MDILYIAGTPVDLPQGFRFAQTISKVDFRDLASRNVNFTNAVTLPPTPTNEALLGFARNENSLSSQPYTLLDCKLVQNGTETIPAGICYLNGANARGFPINIFENVVGLFDFIGDKKVNVLNYIAPSAWSAAGIDAARLATTGPMAVVLNWGKAGAIYQFDYFLPCFSYAEMVTKILESTGLTLSAPILSDDKVTDLVIPYALDKWEYPESFGAPYKFSVANALADQPITMATATAYRVTMDFDTAGTNNGTYQGAARIFDLATDQATVPVVSGLTGSWLNGQFRVGVTFDTVVWPAPGDTFDFELIRLREGVETVLDTETIDEATYPVAPGYQVILTTTPDVYRSGDTFYLQTNNASSNGIEILVKSGLPNPVTTPVNGTFIRMDIPTAPDRSSIVWNQLMPDITQRQVLEDFTTRFGIVYKQVGQTLILKTLQEIIADRAGAVNWTSKRVNKDSDAVAFKSTIYGQTSRMEYEDQVSDAALGSGSFTIPNTILPEVKTLYSSPFGNALTAAYSGGNKALIPVYGTTSTGIDTFENEPGLRLLTLRDKEAGEGAITFNAIARSDYRVGYFLDVTQMKDTGFQYFLDEQYGLVTEALQRAKIPTHTYNLNEQDIASYDPHKLIFDNDAYYIVNRIINFIPGRQPGMIVPTKVEVFKVG